MANTFFLEIDFWKKDGRIIERKLKEIKNNLTILDDFNYMINELYRLVFEELTLEADMSKDTDERVYKMQELLFIQKKLCNIKVSSFYNKHIDKRILYGENGIDEEAWETCYKFIIDRFDGTFKDISF